jgi:hypothetical protein
MTACKVMRSSGMAGALAITLAWALLAGQASAAFYDTPHVAGSFQDPVWQPGANPMTDNLDGTWSATFSGLSANARYEFKITDGTWDSTHPGPNSWFYADNDGSITIILNNNSIAGDWSPWQYRLQLSHDPGSWTAVGNWQAQIGGFDWSNNNSFTQMVPQGGGIYSYDAHLDPGTYLWKAVVTGSWDAIGYNERSVDAGNWEFTLNSGEFVRMSVDAFDGTIRQQVIPEPASLGLAGLMGLVLLCRRRN